MSEKTIQYERILDIVRRLRGEGGCPWDREQTHATLKAPMIEEACEAVCGINIYEQTGNSENLKEELGDVLFQVLLNAQIAEEEGLFSMEDVCETVADKMIRRHPHVFGDTTVDSTADCIEKWDRQKTTEYKGKEPVEEYLPAAFEESKRLVDVAVKRKAEKAAKKLQK